MSVTVELPDELAERARALAAERGVTMDEVVLETVSANLPAGNQRSRRLGFVNIGMSSTGQTSDDLDEMLDGGFGGS